MDTASSGNYSRFNEGAMKLRIGKPLASDLFLDRDWVFEKRKNIFSFSLKSKKNDVPLLILSSQHPHSHSKLEKINHRNFWTGFDCGSKSKQCKTDRDCSMPKHWQEYSVLDRRRQWFLTLSKTFYPLIFV